MADSASIIASSSDYRGDALLGGAEVTPFQIDTRPLNQLAQFTFYRDRQFWNQQQQNAKDLALQASTMASINVNNLFGDDKDKMLKDRDKAITEVSKLLKDIPTDAKGFANKYAEMSAIVGDVNSKYDTRVKRALNRQSQIGVIQKRFEGLPELQELYINRLDEAYKATDGLPDNPVIYNTVNLPDIAPVTSTTDVMSAGKGNQDIVSTVSYFNPTANLNKVSEGLYKFGQSNLPARKILDANGQLVDNPDYQRWAKGKSQNEILAAETKRVSAENSEVGRLMTGVGDNFVSVISKYYDADGNFDEEAFKNDNAGIPMLTGMYAQLKQMSDYSEKKIADIGSGVLTNEGISYKLPGGFKADDFRPGVIKDFRRVTPEQMLMAENFSKFGGSDTISNKVIQTDAAIKAADRAAANFRATLGYKRTKDGWVKIDDGKEKTVKTIDMPTLLFNDNLKRISDWMDRNKIPPGVGLKVTANAIDPITKKALGIGAGSKIGSDGKEIPDTNKDDVLVRYFRDHIEIEKRDGTKIPTTYNNLAQGYINAIAKDPGVAQGFQTDAENAMGDVNERVISILGGAGGGIGQPQPAVTDDAGNMGSLDDLRNAIKK